MKRLAVIPSEPIALYLSAGHSADRLREYFNPGGFFDEVYLLSPLENDDPDLLGMKAIRTEPHQLQQRIKELDIDIVRAYGGYWAGNMACDHKVSNVPVVVSIHDSRPSRIYNSIRKADIVFCMSEIVRKTVLKKFNNLKTLWIMPNRVDFNVMHPFSNSETRDLDRQYPYKFRIIHVGRKVVEKNLSAVIKALRILGKDYCLLAIGQGGTADYAGLAQSEGVVDRCIFIEGLEQAELARYYSWADCMCTPSLCEGFGMVFIEAMACAAVVVTSDIEPMNEYIKDLTNGILVKEYQDPLALADAIRQACENQPLRATIKQNARSSVECFEKGRINALEAFYYERILQMKEDNLFFMPYYRRLALELERSIKKILPESVKKKLIDYIMSAGRPEASGLIERGR